MTLPESRAEAVNWIARYLRQKSQPRLLLFIILVFTGIIGAASSFLMLHAGLAAMYVRYPIAALIAYLVFLLLHRLWQGLQAHQPDLAMHLEEMGTEPGVHNTQNGKTEDKQPGSKRSFLDALDGINFWISSTMHLDY